MKSVKSSTGARGLASRLALAPILLALAALAAIAASSLAASAAGATVRIGQVAG